ncbi:3-hydroxy-5-phosphonooxypentane-2,4-dione thiolase, partial [Candidatus Hakubella thermalkaliphila]
MPIVLRVTGRNIIRDENLSSEGLTVSMENAVRLNAAAVALTIYVGSQNQKGTLLNLAKLIDEGHCYGMPVLAVTAVGKNMVRDARYLALSCRIAAELGAHFVKTYYCDGFEKLVKTCPVPLVMAGGKKTS